MQSTNRVQNRCWLVLMGPDELMPLNKDYYLCLSCCDSGKLNDRLSVIRENSDVSQWRYVGTKNNLADIASRGLLPDNCAKTEFWIQGPAFLQRSEDYWPPRPAVLPPLPISDPEVKVKEGKFW